MNLALAAFLLVQGGGGLPKPAIRQIRVAPDTVWFVGDRGFDTVGVRYCFARRTREWCPLPASTPSVPPPLSVPATPNDSVAVAPGLTLLCRPHLESGAHCDAYGLQSADDGRVHWLIPRLTRASRALLTRAIDLETEQTLSMSTIVSAHVVEPQAVWLGLAGGFPEGEGAFGGLLRFHRARRTIETIVHPKLAAATVTALAIDRRALWVGTAHPGEFGYWGSTGILRRDLATGRWSTLDSATTPLPDNLVQALAAVGGALYVATQDGLAVVDLRTGQWTVRYFRRTSVAGSDVYALDARPLELR